MSAKDWLGMVVFVLVFMSLPLSVMYLSSALSVKVWNKIHSTNYSAFEWLTGEDIIKNYSSTGEVKTFHIKK